MQQSKKLKSSTVTTSERSSQEYTSKPIYGSIQTTQVKPLAPPNATNGINALKHHKNEVILSKQGLETLVARFGVVKKPNAQHNMS